MKGVASKIQLTGLANGAECDLNSSAQDLMTVAVVACPNLSSKASGGADDCAVVCVLEVGVNPQRLDVGAPVVPIRFPFLGSRSHSPIGDGRICNSEITLVLSLLECWKRFQQAPCGRGKWLRKRVRKCLLDGQYHRLDGLKEREGMSAMSFSFPGT